MAELGVAGAVPGILGAAIPGACSVCDPVAMDPQHRELARIGLAAVGGFWFVLAGGYALEVQFEIRMGVQSEARLCRVLSQSWLGEPIPVEGAEAILVVELVRRGVGGIVAYAASWRGSTIVLLEAGYQGSIFTLDSAQVLNECFRMGEIGCPEAYKLLGAMADENRRVRLPGHHGEVC